MIMFIRVPLGGRNIFRVSILEEEKGEPDMSKED